MKKTLSIVVPCYKSASCLDALVSAISQIDPFELILVDDGSPDDFATWNKIVCLAQHYPWIHGIQHRRNYGQDSATMTGFRHVKGNYVVVMDDDLQHDPNDIPTLLAAIQSSSYDIIYANFGERHHKLWKRLGSWFTGKVAEWLINKPAHIYLSSFKIIRADVVKEVTNYTGPFPYVDPLLLQLTNRLSQVTVTHHKRVSGESTYTFAKSLQRWARLAFSFSLTPLRISMWCGMAFSILGLCGALSIILYRLMSDTLSEAHAGWASLIVTTLTFGGLQMLFIGILGEYIGRSHISISQSPQSSIAQTTKKCSLNDE